MLYPLPLLFAQTFRTTTEDREKSTPHPFRPLESKGREVGLWTLVETQRVRVNLVTTKPLHDPCTHTDTLFLDPTHFRTSLVPRRRVAPH